MSDERGCTSDVTFDHDTLKLAVADLGMQSKKALASAKETGGFTIAQGSPPWAVAALNPSSYSQSGAVIDRTASR
jgi:hypothetical protein